MAPLLPVLLAAASAHRSLVGEYLVRVADESPDTHSALLRDAAPLAPATVFRIGALRLAHFKGVNASALRQLRASKAVRYVEALDGVAPFLDWRRHGRCFCDACNGARGEQQEYGRGPRPTRCGSSVWRRAVVVTDIDAAFL